MWLIVIVVIYLIAPKQLNVRPSIFWLVVILGALMLLGAFLGGPNIETNTADLSKEQIKKSPFVQLFTGEE
ncbi:MAG: hypothetical protein HQL29_01855 [Candidatus Omnitrophica bacterium]|nr:hypothetical protein [Candidatus Omnitrophota bacterium]